MLGGWVLIRSWTVSSVQSALEMGTSGHCLRGYQGRLEYALQSEKLKKLEIKIFLVSRA